MKRKKWVDNQNCGGIASHHVDGVPLVECPFCGKPGNQVSENRSRCYKCAAYFRLDWDKNEMWELKQ